ncbi:MAG: hypothetical protein IJZ37_00535 [Clostridia bacterium]|nr:hypothetical protein [Clostridia bacterium]MBQ8235152.1 hypothetical protein [Clostridia bacterium]MBQ8398954.1 hypothetical protein [Clostridia bacterium]
MKKSVFALFVLLCLLFSSCSADQTTVSTDLLQLSAILEKNEYAVTSYSQDDSMLSALREEMASNLQGELSGSLEGYLYAQNPETGNMDLELFVFEKEQDAKLLLEYMNTRNVFVEGESECRIDHRVVYMGYLSVLELVEETA